MTTITKKKIRVVFCWGEISGYMAACFRELATRTDVEPLFLAFGSGRNGSGGRFHDDIVRGLPCKLFEKADLANAALIKQWVREHRPDVVVLCGWFHSPYRALVNDRELASVRFVMTMDTPWWGRPKQWLGRILLRRFMKQFAITLVTGERSWQYALRLGIPEVRIRRGMYGVDFRMLSQCYPSRIQFGKWPKQFLFAGRLAREKGLDILVKSYQEYRKQVASPWPLVCCGAGPMNSAISNIDGLQNAGFVQPQDISSQFTNSGVFVLPSRYDPWPLAIVEAAASGMPIICSEACGSAVELVRPFYNGFLCTTGNEASLTAALVHAHQSYDELPEMGKRSLQLAEAYSAEMWSERVVNIFEEIADR